ncbi:UDP-glucosyltransferase 2-like [Frieseomelitta varia]|uniref:UDP-glucosyltransferase 2-like n=1 Tax=Frieseomelitta varia TaxID=561572 RepID=UPI001CB69D1D|nr:UDP-glucosyltransferase 2-like [Frieseomelitta varia]
MKRNITSLFLVLCALCVAEKTECYRILATIATPSYSHQIPYRALWLELHKRGHKVVLVTPDPIPNINSPNFTQIDINHAYEIVDTLNFVQARFNGEPWTQFIQRQMMAISVNFVENILNNTEFKKIYAPDSDAKFDILLTEYLFGPAAVGIAHRFNVPIIGLSSFGLPSWSEHVLGGLALPSHESTWEMEANTGPNLPFLKRVENFVCFWRYLHFMYTELLPISQQLAEKYLGPLPPLIDIMKNNTSMVFINQAIAISPARPQLANAISFTSFHIQDKLPPLPKDLQEFVDGAKKGFIYFSLGTNARSSTLPVKIQRVFCDVFATLPYRIVWKHEEDLPGKPDNVYIAKWLPQQSLLAHPNVKLFIYQGGLQSSEEAIHFGVPVLGFAIFADQDYQVGRMEALGIGKLVNSNTRSMKRNITSLFLVLCVLCVAEHTDCYRILAAIVTPSYSHQVPYRALFLELHKRGHEVVFITPNPIPNINLPNFTQIDISYAYKIVGTLNFVQSRFNRGTWIQIIEKELMTLSVTFAEYMFNNTEFKKMYAPDSDAKFDIFLTEYLYGPAAVGIAHRFNVPLIGLSSYGLPSWNEHVLGGLVLPSHESTWEMEANTGRNLPFLKRVRNFVSFCRYLHFMYTELLPISQQLAEKYLGPLPPLTDIMKNNTSMVFINQAIAISPARPQLANAISFTSFHIQDKLPPLPKDLQEFVDGAKNGFIYFSLGTNAKSSELPVEILRVFCDVFATLPYRIVWKYEKDLPGKPDNVYTAKWLPQQSILAHPNVKLFIYQGGLQSSEEAIHFGVPVLGFAIFADQDYQVGRMESLGIGKRLEITTVTKEELKSSIIELITNKEYKERMINTRNIVQDTPYDMVKNLAWWTEYVIRTKGAPHLRSSITFQSWYQRYDLDVIAFLTIVVFLIASSTLYLIAKIVVYLHRQIIQSQKLKMN